MLRCLLCGSLAAYTGCTVRASAVLPVQEYAPEPPLLPPHPVLRAKARIIIDHFDRQFTPLFYRILIRCYLVPADLQCHLCFRASTNPCLAFCSGHQAAAPLHMLPACSCSSALLPLAASEASGPWLWQSCIGVTQC